MNRFMEKCLKLILTYFAILIYCFACGQKDEEKIIGKWQNEQDWFEYKKESKYSAGKSMLTMVKDFKYSIDPTKRELTMYTNEENQTYYLVYQFIGNDTLAIFNRLSSDTSLVKFYRIK